MDKWQSEDIKELVGAIVNAQIKMVPASKDHVNPYFKSKYADLPSCWESVACFREEGIAITQSPMEGPDGHVMLDTQLSHTSGQWMRSRLKIRVAKDDPQGYGSAITYARRYALGCMTGLVTEEDDDGNAASQPQQSAQAFQQQKRAVQEKINELRGPQAATTTVKLPNYGRNHCKGKLISDPVVTTEDLQFYLNGAIRNLADPGKAQYHANDQRLKDAIEVELLRRENNQTNDEQAEWNATFTKVEADPDLAELKELVKSELGIETLLYSKTTAAMREVFVQAFKKAAIANNIMDRLEAVGL